MCRLLGMTETSYHPIMRRLFFNQLMLLSSTDGAQFDGAGVSDGTTVYKSAYPYMALGQQWISKLDQDSIWIGHVRKASNRTGLSAHEAHPFLMKTANGAHFIATHNGGIRGFDEHQDGQPDVDSYRALLALRDKIDGDINVNLINEWIATFKPHSQWTFMFMQNGQRLYIARGQRDMHYVPFGNGFIFNTSKSVLEHFRTWISMYWAQNFKIGRISDIKPFDLATIDIGSSKFALQSLMAPIEPPDTNGKFITQSPDGESISTP